MEVNNRPVLWGSFRHCVVVLDFECNLFFVEFFLCLLPLYITSYLLMIVKQVGYSTLISSQYRLVLSRHGHIAYPAATL
jgi:hypothetical protein